MFPSYAPWSSVTKSFSLVRRTFLQTEGLPFAEVLSEEEIEAAFVAENAGYATDNDHIYTPGVTLWAWLSLMRNTASSTGK